MQVILTYTENGSGRGVFAGRLKKVKMAAKKTVGTEFGTNVASAVEILFKQNIVVTAVKVKYPGIDPLLIVSAKTTEGPKIAFIGGVDMDAVGKVFGKMARTESIPWKEDEYAMRRLDKDRPD